MIYIVTGLFRSGTSMMMHALIKGGMRAVYERKDIDGMWHGDYHPNQNGFFELSEADLYAEDFPRKFNKYLIKVPLKRLNSLVEKSYPMRIVFMHRDYEQVKRSFEKMIETGIIKDRKPPDEYIHMMPFILGGLIGNKAIKTFDVFDYDHVIADPVKYLEILRKHGWIFNVKKAAAIPDARLRHYSKED